MLKYFNHYLAIAILIRLLFSSACSYAQNEKPNVLIIVVDDLKDWVGHLNGYEGTVHTPNIDRLASEGVAFTNAHTASPLCCPSRNAMLLGKRPSTTGLYNNQQWWKPVYPQEITLPQYFKENGYYTVGAGKVFHHTPGNNPPCSWNEYEEQVFDDPWLFADWSVEKYAVYYGYRGPIEEYPEWKPLNGIYPMRPELDWGAIPEKPESEYGDVKAVNFAEEFLKREQTQPFFLCIGIYRPHLPWHVPQKYFDKYPLEDIVLPEVPEDDLTDVPEEGRKLAAATSKDFFQIKEEGKWEEAVQAYLASISFADARVGAIYDALKQSKHANNTIVIFWSDHGWHLGTKNHWHKSTLWEEGTHIPFIVKVPGITKPGDRCDHPVDMTNIYPTLISLCNLPSKSDLDGHDMSEILKDTASEWNWPAITEFQPGQTAIRTKDWRFIRYSDKSEELYDRKKDRNEWRNLAYDQRYKKVLENHRKWIPDNFADPLPGKNAFFFDPYQYTWIDMQTKEFIDGKK